MDHCKMFRNYPSIHQSNQNVTLIEAIRATWATPHLLSPIPLGPDGRKEEAFSALLGFGMPMNEAIREAYRVFGGEARVSILLSLGSGHRGVVSIDDKNTRAEVGDRTAENYEVVAEDVQRRLGNLGIYYRISVDHGLEGWRLYYDRVGDIKSHVDAYLSRIGPSNNLNQCLSASQRISTASLEQICASCRNTTLLY